MADMSYWLFWTTYLFEQYSDRFNYFRQIYFCYRLCLHLFHLRNHSFKLRRWKEDQQPRCWFYLFSLAVTNSGKDNDDGLSTKSTVEPSSAGAVRRAIRILGWIFLFCRKKKDMGKKQEKKLWEKKKLWFVVLNKFSIFKLKTNSKWHIHVRNILKNIG